ncbi:MAG: hypothetical protein WCX83_02110 [Candidatus Cloacimonas sp.]|nr:hypothetical protein [Candidatus Cloacimonadota bacterium]
MPRCHRTSGLDAYPIRPDGGNAIDNARILCRECYNASIDGGPPVFHAPPFSQATKDGALRRAGNRCECERMGGCH